MGAQLVWFYPDLGEHVNFLRKNDQFVDPQVITRILAAVFSRDAVFNPTVFTALYWATLGVGILALVGLFTRVALVLFAAGTWIFVSHLFSYGDRHHTEALFAIFLVLLALAPSGTEVQLSQTPKGWPRDSASARVWPCRV